MSVLYFRAFVQAVTMTTGLLSIFPWFMLFSQKCFPLGTITKTITKREAFLDKMSFPDEWPRCEKIFDMILCRWLLSLAYCDLFAAMHILLQRSISVVNPGSSRAQLHLQVRMKIAKAKALDHVDGLLRRPWRVNERHGACRCESSSGLLPTNWIQSLFLSWRKDGATVICSCVGRYHTTPYSWSAGKESAGQSKMLQTLKWRCKKAFCMQFARGCGWCNQDIL